MSVAGMSFLMFESSILFFHIGKYFTVINNFCSSRSRGLKEVRNTFQELNPALQLIDGVLIIFQLEHF